MLSNKSLVKWYKKIQLTLTNIISLQIKTKFIPTHVQRPIQKFTYYPRLPDTFSFQGLPLIWSAKFHTGRRNLTPFQLALFSLVYCTWICEWGDSNSRVSLLHSQSFKTFSVLDTHVWLCLQLIPILFIICAFYLRYTFLYHKNYCRTFATTMKKLVLSYDDLTFCTCILKVSCFLSFLFFQNVQVFIQYFYDI